MTSFRTTIKSEKQIPAIDYNSHILLLGSCFTEHISEKLTYYKFDTITNPFGILFNSSALKIAIEQIACNKIYTKTDLSNYNDLWFSYNHHSKFSSQNYIHTLKHINSKIIEANQFIKKASHIIITLGTAWVYTNNETNNIVANCHKVPQKHFTKSLQGIAQITNDLESINMAIKAINKKATILFTVSPVRHLRNGFKENMLSKAHLIVAINKHISNQENNYYIPVYEIMMDDLRDYRFYEADMVHPNSTAINYIWNFLKNSWISDNTKKTMATIESIQKDLHHRPFNKDSEAFKKFKINLNQKMDALKVSHPSIIF